MPQDTDRTQPAAKPRIRGAFLRERIDEAPTIDDVDLVALAQAVIAQGVTLDENKNKMGKTSTRERLVLGVLTLVLSTGGAGATVTAATNLLRQPSPEVIERLDKLDRAVFDEDGHNRVAGLEETQEQVLDLTTKTYHIVDLAHPSQGRFGVPDQGEP